MKSMRLYKREITDHDILKSIVEECDVVRIGLTDQEGMFIVPMNYGYDFIEEAGRQKLVLYLHGAKEGRKAAAVGAGASAAVEMDCRHQLITGDYTCSYSYAYRSIMGTGNIRLLQSEEEKIYGLTKIMEHTAPGADIEFVPAMLERTAVWRLDVRYFTGKERKMK